MNKAKVDQEIQVLELSKEEYKKAVTGGYIGSGSEASVIELMIAMN